MAKYSSAQFETRFDAFLDAVVSEEELWVADNFMNRGVNLKSVSGGGQTALAVYPDYDNNEDVPAVFYINGDSNYQLSITYREMEASPINPRGKRKMLAVLASFSGYLWPTWKAIHGIYKMMNVVPDAHLSFSMNSGAFLPTLAEARQVMFVTRKLFAEPNTFYNEDNLIYPPFEMTNDRL